MSRKDLYNDLAKIAWADANALEFPRYQTGAVERFAALISDDCHHLVVAAWGEACREKQLLQQRATESPYLRELAQCLCEGKPTKALLEAQKEAMSDEEFLEYVLTHSQTEKALFAMSHARRLLALAGREDEAMACDGDGFVSIFHSTAKTLVDAAKPRMAVTVTLPKGQVDGQAQ